MSKYAQKILSSQTLRAQRRAEDHAPTFKIDNWQDRFPKEILFLFYLIGLHYELNWGLKRKNQEAKHEYSLEFS